ncbi:hypothetical protein PHYPSEUDO_002957 [Phytophthora pseudosyringae]|uniref:Uncharacterized protein n=1 Tax=Phytophthora pseudosyringae TaxID=221518 RepID=A0A8T1VRU1_9STRA|nr:hypothetical protein PHYPSEUDO_002957 [Phytophthora pseudosyringae]
MDDQQQQELLARVEATKRTWLREQRRWRRDGDDQKTEVALAVEAAIMKHRVSPQRIAQAWTVKRSSLLYESLHVCTARID